MVIYLGFKKKHLKQIQVYYNPNKPNISPKKVPFQKGAKGSSSSPAIFQGTFVDFLGEYNG